jgi:hypothetical protein
MSDKPFVAEACPTMSHDSASNVRHFVVVVFGLAPAGQLLGRIMRPILVFLSSRGVRLMVYVSSKAVPLDILRPTY